jgi:hypothetical protein
VKITGLDLCFITRFIAQVRTRNIQRASSLLFANLNYLKYQVNVKATSSGASRTAAASQNSFMAMDSTTVAIGQMKAKKAHRVGLSISVIDELALHSVLADSGFAIGLASALCCTFVIGYIIGFLCNYCHRRKREQGESREDSHRHQVCQINLIYIGNDAYFNISS